MIDTGWARPDRRAFSGRRTAVGDSRVRDRPAEGFAGSYPAVVRHCVSCGARGSGRRRAVCVPIETARVRSPSSTSRTARLDQRGVGLGVLWCFGAILCWSRWRLWWFTTSVDREHTFEGLVRFFEAAGGVPKVARTDRMGALGQSQGRRFGLHPPTIGFARHHGIEIKACQAGDAKRKGKVERPFRDLKESFLEELGDTGPARQRRRAEPSGPGCGSAERVHCPGRIEHRGRARRTASGASAGSSPAPRRRFDTAYVETRRVHRRGAARRAGTGSATRCRPAGWARRSKSAG